LALSKKTIGRSTSKSNLKVVKNTLKAAGTLRDWDEETIERPVTAGWCTTGPAQHWRYVPAKSEESLNLCRVVVLRAFENECSWTLGCGKVVHVHHSAVSHKSDKSCRGQQRERLLDAVLEVVQLIQRNACIDEVKKSRWASCLARQLVFECRKLRDELRRQIGLGDVVSIVLWEGVASLAEWTRPMLRREIDLTVGIKDSTTLCLLALDRIVLHGRRHALYLLQRRVYTSNRNDGPVYGGGNCAMEEEK
jgi:hypothetical protein